MAKVVSTTKVSALDTIVKWSADRPDWQRDALRRIVANEVIGDAEVSILERICRGKHGADISSDVLPVAKPITDGDVPKTSATDDSVSLVSVGKLQNVNRIPADQVLTLGRAPGMTIVYGDNGCGKSGYSRVIKKMCRSRGGAPTIRPNAFQPKPKGPATAEIVFTQNGVDHTTSWMDGTPADIHLSHVFVFDSSTASNYLDEDGPASFTPRGLDVLPKLSKLCDLLRDRFSKVRIALIAENTKTSATWTFKSTTAVGLIIASLKADTTEAAIDTLAVLQPAEVLRFDVLTDALKSNPKQKAKETRASAERLKAFADGLKAVEAALSDVALAALEKLLTDSQAAQLLADKFAEASFKDDFAPGTGGELWLTLWEAARALSPTMFPDNEFPATAVDTLCLLCQQPVSESGIARLQAFEKFCKDKTRQNADTLTETLAAKAKTVAAMQPLANLLNTVEVDLGSSSTQLSESATASSTAADARLATLKQNMLTKNWTAPVALQPSVEASVRAAATALEERANTEAAADDPAERAKMQTERDSLADRKMLASLKPQILVQIGRLKQIVRLDSCLKDCSTNASTALNTDLSDKLITEAFRKRFAEEVIAVGLRTLRVGLDDIGGQKGSARFGLRLVDAKEHKVRDVASEGEQRCIALASFLAELSLASHRSALVFDDPVSSLDHGYCGRIAKRLGTEAKDRQVIVFTHNVVFLHDLAAAAEALGIDPAFRHLEWNADAPGLCREGLPWDHQRPEHRFDFLEKEQRRLAKDWGPHPTDEQKREMRQLYSELRATIERIVERVLVADVVFRFRTYINLKNLHELAGIPDTECDEVDRIFQKCCGVTEAHDPSAAKQVAIPDPTDFLTDLTDAKKLLEAIRARRKAKQKK